MPSRPAETAVNFVDFHLTDGKVTLPVKDGCNAEGVSSLLVTVLDRLGESSRPSEWEGTGRRSLEGAAAWGPAAWPVLTSCCRERHDARRGGGAPGGL